MWRKTQTIVVGCKTVNEIDPRDPGSPWVILIMSRGFTIFSKACFRTRLLAL